MHLEVNIGVFEPFLIAEHQNSWISSMNLTIFCWVAGKFKISNGILMGGMISFPKWIENNDFPWTLKPAKIIK